MRVFLNRPLFAAATAPHVPASAAILVGPTVPGTSEEHAHLGIAGNGVFLHAEQYFDERGRALEGEPRDLFIPMAKIDHVDLDG